MAGMERERRAKEANLPLLGRSGSAGFIRRAGLFTLLALAMGLAGMLVQPILLTALGA
jgi:hypothetical protein